VGFDLETTSADPETARIVTAAIVVRGGDRKPETLTWLVNPGIEIPAEATAVHGITTGQAQAGGMDPATAVQEICQRLELAMAPGIPLVIYNAPYDLTVVDRETRRHKMTPFADALAGHAVMVIDPLVLDKHLDQYRKGKRTLTAACDHYGVTLDGAHDSSFDALAAMRVAWKIAVTYPSIATMTLAGLHDLQEKAKADQAAGFQDYLRRQGKDEVIDGAWPYRPFGGDQ
jgi:DNA polymerase-3 subunit epsilon